jgi:hypothetical protein
MTGSGDFALATERSAQFFTEVDCVAVLFAVGSTAVVVCTDTVFEIAQLVGAALTFTTSVIVSVVPLGMFVFLMQVTVPVAPTAGFEHV